MTGFLVALLGSLRRGRWRGFGIFSRGTGSRYDLTIPLWVQCPEVSAAVKVKVGVLVGYPIRHTCAFFVTQRTGVWNDLR